MRTPCWITETSPGSSAGAFLVLFPRFLLPSEEERALVSFNGDFWADTRWRMGDTYASGQRLPLFRALESVLVCVGAGRVPDLPEPAGYRGPAYEGEGFALSK